MDVYAEFEWRGIIHSATNGASDALKRQKMTAYIGFDPTAASLHVGSLLPAMNLARMQRAGHTPIAIVGGGTGLIGDPSGKTGERQLLTEDKVAENLIGIRGQLERFLDFETSSGRALVVNNADWLVSMPMISFLRDVGKHYTVNQMLSQESVKMRIDNKDGVTEGMSFTEFSYMLLQAYDFLVLYDRYDCLLQMGGSDQWGNILRGIDLIRKVRGVTAHGLVSPLFTNTDGSKFGKTEGGTVWLDANLTSPFRFYQFLLNTADADAINYLRSLTWLTQDEVAELKERLEKAPEQREAQRRLARDVTRTVHGETALSGAERATTALFGGDISSLSASEIEDVFGEMPSTSLPRADLVGQGKGVVDLLVTVGLAPSRAEAKRLVAGGGVYLNNRRVGDEATYVTNTDAIEGHYIILRKGARSYHVVQLRD